MGTNYVRTDRAKRSIEEEGGGVGNERFFELAADVDDRDAREEGVEIDSDGIG